SLLDNTKAELTTTKSQLQVISASYNLEKERADELNRSLFNLLTDVPDLREEIDDLVDYVKDANDDTNATLSECRDYVDELEDRSLDVEDAFEIIEDMVDT
ncbi:MAG: hypothetical protein ACOC2U_03760, partial [bacterium]